MSNSPVVRGRITFPSGIAPMTPAHILVELEDISRSDVPSTVLASERIVPGELRDGDTVQFSLAAPQESLNSHSLCSVRVHVDMSGSGEIERGDYITMQSYPVLTRGHGDHVDVEVRRV